MSCMSAKYRFLVMQTGTATALAALVAPALASAQDGRGVQEIVVTAQKRSERIQDVPISITAITEDALKKRGFSQMGDYLLAQPSVMIQDRGPARNQVVIRGVAATVGNETPTVAFYIGETPVTNGLGFGANGFPDLRTFDVGRVEVLRGPQGTLYGAGSMGGTVKVVPNEAVIGRIEGAAEATVSSTAHGGIGYNGGAAINLPLGETLAVRMTGYHYRDAGFIDNRYPGTPDPTAPVAALGGASWADLGVSAFGVAARHDKDANSTDVNGLRASVTFQPNDALKINLGALYQHAQSNGLPENLPSLGTYVQSRALRERLKDAFQLYNATISYDLGIASVTSATAYVKRDQLQSRDLSSFFVGAPVSLADDNSNKNFTQEIRIASDPARPIAILLGAFYTRSTSHATQDTRWLGTGSSLTEFGAAVLGAAVTPDDILYKRDDHNIGKQIAGFGEVSFSPVKTVKLSAGLRVARYNLSTSASADGVLNGGATGYFIDSKESVTTPNFQIEFKPDRSQLYYLRAAKGFRLGAPNQPLPTTCAADLASLGLTTAPSSVKSDTLWSYEAGVKQSLNGGRTVLNAAAFYIDWKDIQTGFLLPNCGFSFGGNAGTARSMGVEMDFSTRIGKSFTLNGALSYTDAKLREDSPAGTGVGGRKGDRLPGIPRWSVQGGLQYDFSVAARDGFARIDGRYISDYLNRFPGATDGTPSPSGNFVVFDARIGTDITKGLQAEIFANNLFDRKQLLIVDTELPDQRQVLGRPRTIGATLRYKF